MHGAAAWGWARRDEGGWGRVLARGVAVRGLRVHLQAGAQGEVRGPSEHVEVSAMQRAEATVREEGGGLRAGDGGHVQHADYSVLDPRPAGCGAVWNLGRCQPLVTVRPPKVSRPRRVDDVDDSRCPLGYPP